MLGFATFGAALALSALNKTGPATRRNAKGIEITLILFDLVSITFFPFSRWTTY